MQSSNIRSTFVIVATALALNTSAVSADTIRIGGTGNYGPVLPVAAAQELKLFDKLGVTVIFTTFASGAASMEGLAAKEVDLINYFPPGLALAKRSGVKATVVGAGTLTPKGWHIMVKSDSKLNGVKDLSNKKLVLPQRPQQPTFLHCGQQLKREA